MAWRSSSIFPFFSAPSATWSSSSSRALSSEKFPGEYRVISLPTVTPRLRASSTPRTHLSPSSRSKEPPASPVSRPGLSRYISGWPMSETLTSSAGSTPRIFGTARLFWNSATTGPNMKGAAAVTPGVLRTTGSSSRQFSITSFSW